jgi:hypothetical protein
VTVILGVDPGGTTGIALLGGPDGVPVLLQSSREGVLTVVWALVERVRDQGGKVSAIAVERFVAGPRSGRLATPAGAATARVVIADLCSFAQEVADVPVYPRSAAEVKPWATDARLKAAGIEHRGMPHALDAARHALFCAVRDYGMPDPLSRRSVS